MVRARSTPNVRTSSVFHLHRLAKPLPTTFYRTEDACCSMYLTAVLPYSLLFARSIASHVRQGTGRRETGPGRVRHSRPGCCSGCRSEHRAADAAAGDHDGCSAAEDHGEGRPTKKSTKCCSHARPLIVGCMKSILSGEREDDLNWFCKALERFMIIFDEVHENACRYKYTYSMRLHVSVSKGSFNVIFDLCSHSSPVVAPHPIRASSNRQANW